MQNDTYLASLPKEFWLWAFGEGANTPVWNHTMDLLEEWNRLHGDQLILQPQGNIRDDMRKMVTLWKENNHKNGN